MAQCRYTEKIMKDRVRCPACDKDYEIVAFTHLCDPALRCGPKGTQYVERYVDKLTRDEKIAAFMSEGHSADEALTDEILETLVAEPPQAECNNCETARKNKTTARKATCPECNFNGYYVHGADKLCPSCKYVKENPPKPIETARAITPIETARTCVDEPTKRTVEMHFEIKMTSTHSGIVIQSYDVGTDEFGDILVAELEHKMAAMYVSALIDRFNTESEWYWVPKSQLDMVCLRRLYNKFGAEGRPPLGRYAKHVTSVEVA